MDKVRKEGRPGQLAHETRAESRADFECVYMSIHICRAIGHHHVVRSRSKTVRMRPWAGGGQIASGFFEFEPFATRCPEVHG